MEPNPPPSTPTASPKKRKWPRILAGLGAFIVAAVGLAFYFTAGMTRVVETHLAFLRQGNHAAAYALTSKDFQKATSLEHFTAFVKRYPSLAKNRSHTFSTRSRENGLGTVKGSLTAQDGAVTPVEFKLVKEEGEWRILAIEIKPPGASAAGQETPEKGLSQPQAVSKAARVISILTCERVEEPDLKPLGVRQEFSSSAPEIHALVKLAEVKAGSKLKGEWVAVDAIETPNYVINSTPLSLESAGDLTAHFKISKPARGWPPGKYKLDLYLDDLLMASAPFAVVAAPGPESGAGGPQMVTLLTCGGVTGKDYQPVNPTDLFPTEAPEIHAVAKIKNARAGTKVSGAWIAVDAVETPNYEIKRSEASIAGEGDASVHFAITKPTQGWPPGNYRLDLFLDGRPAGSTAFAIRTAASPGAVSAAPAAPPPAAPITFDFGPVQPDPKRLWTVAVYMGADNDLDPFAFKDLQEMARGLPEEGVECLALVDRGQGPKAAGDDGADKVVRIRRAGGKGPPLQVLASPGELNSADPAVLRGFLTAVIKTFPARHYALIMWNHGGGWASHLHDSQAPGTPQGHDQMSLPRLRQAISGALRDAGLKKLALVGFDMCLMAQLETAAEISDVAEIMVASQAIEPGDGWPYEEVLPLFGDESLGLRRLGARVVEVYGKHWAGRKEPIATLSAIDLAEVQRLTETMKGMSGKLAQSVPEKWPAISRAFFYSESYADRTDIRKGPSGLASVDLLDLSKRLRHSLVPFPAEREYQDLVAIMDRAVIAAYASPKHRLSRGLAIYAPTVGRQYNPQYEQTQWAKTSDWPKFLTTLHQTQKQQVAAPKITDLKVVEVQSGRPVTSGKPGGGFRLEATVEGENVLWVQYLQAKRDESHNGLVILEKSYVLDPDYHRKKLAAVADIVDLIMPEFKGNRNRVSREFVGSHLMVTNGVRAGRATIDGSNLSDLTRVAVPVLVRRKNLEPHFATVFFNTVTWQATNVVGEIPQPGGAPAYRQIKPQPEDQVTLLLEFISDAGKPGYLEGETLQWREGLEFLVNTDSPGEIMVALRAESIGGRSDFAKTTFMVEGYTAEEQRFAEQAKKLTLKDLVGKWRWHGLKDGQWQPLPAYVEIAPLPSDPKMLGAVIRNPADPQWKATKQLVLLDTRLKPTLRLLSFDEQGLPQEAMNFTVLVSRWEGDSPRLVMKYLVPKGWLLLWAKEASAPPSGSATPESPPAWGAPPAASDPPKPPSLVGVWRSREGEVLKIGASTFEVYTQNQLLDKGSYEVRGNQIFTRSLITGEKMRLSFHLRGAMLTLKDSSGEVSHYQRVQ